MLVAAVSLQTGLPLAVVRKEPKVYGTMEQVEGYAPPGALAVLLETSARPGTRSARPQRSWSRRGSRSSGSCSRSIGGGGADHLREAGYDVAAVAVLRPAGSRDLGRRGDS